MSDRDLACLTADEARQLHSDGKAQLFESGRENSFSTCNPSTMERILATCAKECDAGKRHAALRRGIEACDGKMRTVMLKTLTNRELFYTGKVCRLVC